jgi:serine/threonine protein kinase
MHVLASEIEGTVLAGLRIEAVVGRSGMGVVYRATQLDLDRTVAVKVIAAELLDDDAARSRFVQESRLAASIDHPHVIPIHGAGEEDGVPYLVMQYVAGDDARSLVRRAGPIAPARAARIVAQVGDALDAAHAAGLVHRDVKPANVLLAAGDHAYLSDFGLTRHLRSISSGPTGSGQWVGTLDYVAPEQIRGGQVDARADVYALGCVLFFLLTGEVPFLRNSDEARLWAHLTEPPRRISAVAPAVPRAFDAVIERALAKAPDDRYPSAGDLGRAAVAAAAGAASSRPSARWRSGTPRRPRARRAPRTGRGLAEDHGWPHAQGSSPESPRCCSGHSKSRHASPPNPHRPRAPLIPSRRRLRGGRRSGPGSRTAFESADGRTRSRRSDAGCGSGRTPRPPSKRSTFAPRVRSSAFAGTSAPAWPTSPSPAAGCGPRPATTSSCSSTRSTGGPPARRSRCRWSRSSSPPREMTW